MSPAPRIATIAVGLALGLSASAASAQGFDPGSDGGDGVLACQPQGVLDCPVDGADLIFDPAAIVPPLDADGDGVFEFESVHIPPDVHLVLRIEELGPGPVVWKVRGEVEIDGRISLDGRDGSLPDAPDTQQAIGGLPGPGGFAGGSSITGMAGLNGRGPAGGNAGAVGGFSGNAYLVPLIGGSGGGGNIGIGSGGGGGGAILIAAGGPISINGTISASGGREARLPVPGSPASGRGGGGGIRLVAPIIAGNEVGRITTNGNGTLGQVRLEALEHAFRGQIGGRVSRVTLGSQPVLDIAPQPVLRIVSIQDADGDHPVPSNPSGRFVPAPDVAVDADAVVVHIEGTGIPDEAGQPPVVTVAVRDETERRLVTYEAALVGDFERRTAAVAIQLLPGFSQIAVETDWGG